MPQQFVHFDAPNQPFRIANGGTTSASLEVVTTCFLTWDDGTQETVPPTAGVGGTAITQIPTGATFNGLTTVWLALTYRGAAGQIYLTPEQRYGDIDTDLQAFGTATYHWAVLARIHGIRVEVFQQAPPGLGPNVVVVGAGTPSEGDMLVFSSGTWQLLAPGTPYEVIASTGTDPGYITVQNLLKATVLPHAGDLVWNNGGTVTNLATPVSSVPQGYLSSLVNPSTGVAAWAAGVDWRTLSAPTVSAVHNNCSNCTVEGTARAGTLSLTMTGSLSYGGGLVPLVDLHWDMGYTYTPCFLCEGIATFGFHFVPSNVGGLGGTVSVWTPDTGGRSFGTPMLVAYLMIPLPN